MELKKLYPIFLFVISFFLLSFSNQENDKPLIPQFKKLYEQNKDKLDLAVLHALQESNNGKVKIIIMWDGKGSHNNLLELQKLIHNNKAGDLEFTESLKSINGLLVSATFKGILNLIKNPAVISIFYAPNSIGSFKFFDL